jgi:hypothetical protein
VNGSVDVVGAGDRNVGLVALGVDEAELGCRVTGLPLLGSMATAGCDWILIRHPIGISLAVLNLLKTGDRRAGARQIDAAPANFRRPRN